MRGHGLRARRWLPVLLLMTGPAVAGELSVEVLSAHVWRGWVLNDEYVSQAGFNVHAPGGFVAGAWCNVDLTDRNNSRSRLTEFNASVGYAPPMEGPLSLEAGLIHYDYPRSGGRWNPEQGSLADGIRHTREVYVTAALGMLLAPRLTVYYDMGRVEGLFTEVGIAHDWSWDNKTGVAVHTRLGYGDADYMQGRFGIRGGAPTHLAAGLELRRCLLPTLTCAAVVSHSRLLDSDLRTAAGDANHTWGGIQLRHGF